MNRKVILYIASSLDGYIADSQGGIDWLNSVDIVEEDKSYDDFIKEIDTVIMGRKTYDQVVNELSPDIYPYEEQKSYIITNRLEENKDNRIFTNQNLIELIKEIKKEDGKAIWIIGGASIVEPLVKRNLIDEYRICILPILLGNGIKLFKNFDQRINLNTESIDVKNQMVYIKYTKKD